MMLFSISYLLLLFINTVSSSIELSVSSVVTVDCHSRHLKGLRGCRSLPLGHALLMAKLVEPHAANSLQLDLELSQENCAALTVSMFTDVERLHLMGSNYLAIN